MNHNLQLMPLEQLVQWPLTEQDNGSSGENREGAKRCLIPANNDVQAIECWLSEYKKHPTTHRNYRKDAERLFLWAIIERKKALSSLAAEDLLLYSQ